jgi:hypothetical protein
MGDADTVLFSNSDLRVAPVSLFPTIQHSTFIIQHSYCVPPVPMRNYTYIKGFDKIQYGGVQSTPLAVAWSTVSTIPGR